VKGALYCRNTDLDSLIKCAFNAIIMAKLGLVSKDEALDALWEYLVNIDYEIKVIRG